jgi:hypothetical protein
MRHAALFIFAALGLCGCDIDPAENAQSPAVPRGRYVGIGTYPATRLWAHVALPKSEKPASAANSSDDGQIIVVVDTSTGEVRQCGNYSGICIGMNPWTGALPAALAGPVTLTRHEADLQREDDERHADDDAAANIVSTSKPKG